MTINDRAIKFYSTQSINIKDKQSILEVLASGYLSRGPKIEEFEKKIGKICNNKNVLTVNSATSALQLAYQIHGIKKNSIVWTTPLTFVATANTAIHFGAKIDFVDIDPATLNICPSLLKKKLKEAKNSSNLPDFLTVVHFGGNPCDMDKIFELSKKYKFKIIEDASHALGATYKGTRIGECNYSCAIVFSFHPVKMITTGEGGALLLNSETDKQKACNLRSHGIDLLGKEKNTDRPEWYYEQVDLGYNFRMSEIQAGLGSSQIDRLGSFVETRNQLAECYRESLSDLPIKFQETLSNCYSSHHLFTIEITDRNFARDDLYRFFRDRNIGCQVHYIPVHMQPFYKEMGFSEGMFKNVEHYFLNCLSLPLHQGLKEIDIQFVSDELHDFFKKN